MALQINHLFAGAANSVYRAHFFTYENALSAHSAAPTVCTINASFFGGGHQKGGAVILIVFMAHTGQKQLQNDLIVECSLFRILTKLNDT